VIVVLHTSAQMDTLQPVLMMELPLILMVISH
jgi:hypothetical protein